jgi:hypothetical protein
MVAMTNAELQELAQIERRLVEESPQLRRLFDRAAAVQHRRRRQAWCWAGGVTLLVSTALLVAGLTVGLPGLAVFALCPLLTFGVVLLGSWLPARLRPARARRR